jgi:hypothetical protein
VLSQRQFLSKCPLSTIPSITDLPSPPVMNHIHKSPQSLPMQHNSHSIRQPLDMSLRVPTVHYIQQLEITPLHLEIRSAFLQRPEGLETAEKVLVHSALFRPIAACRVRTDRFGSAKKLADLCTELIIQLQKAMVFRAKILPRRINFATPPM